MENDDDDVNEKKELDIEDKLFKAADAMRGAMEPSEYKHIALGLLFLKYISESFEKKYQELLNEYPEGAEDVDEYRADNIFWVPKGSRWENLKNNARQPNIGRLIDDAMIEIEKENDPLKGVLPKNYAKPEISSVMLGDLVELFSNIKLSGSNMEAKDLLGRVYEYFISNFASSEGKKGGEFFTPRSIVRLLVEMLEPKSGRVYDPCSGSGGMFILSEEFVKERGGKVGDIAVYGQEMNNTTWRLSKMNLAIRGIDSEIKWNNEGTFHKNEFPDMRFDYILANPPFNISDWGANRLQEDPRWKYGIPPNGNANYGWLQHMLYQLAPNGTAGIVLANGSMASNTNNEGKIRKKMIEDDVIDCMVALPSNLFYSVTIPACLWFLAKSKGSDNYRKRSGEILFIDARSLGEMTSRIHRSFSEEDRNKITSTYHNWRNGESYEDIAGFCKSATLEEIERTGFVLTPGRYVGVEDELDDGIPFEEKFEGLVKELINLQENTSEIDKSINKNLKMIISNFKGQSI